MTLDQSALEEAVAVYDNAEHADDETAMKAAILRYLECTNARIIRNDRLQKLQDQAGLR